MIRSALVRLALATALAVACTPARAASGPVPDPALIARAQAEGTVVYYAAMAAPQLEALAARFKAAYGITVQTLAGGSPELVSRVVTEQRAGRYEVDVFGNSGYETDQVKRLGLLETYRPPEAAELLAGAADPDGYWFATFANTDAIAYNPGVLHGMKPPATWEEFANKEWRGQFGIYADGFEFYAALKSALGADHANAILRAYAANGVRLVRSHTQATNLVDTGELTAAADIYAYAALELADKGRPVVLVNPNPTIIELALNGILKNAPHPNAARLFTRWMLSRDTQRWIRTNLHRVSMRKDVKNDPRLLDPKVRYAIANPANSANAAADVASFKAIFGIP